MTKAIEKEDFFLGLMECPQCKVRQETSEFYNYRKGYFRTNGLCRTCDNEWRRRPQVHKDYAQLPEPSRANFGEGGLRCTGCGGVFSTRMFIKYGDQYNTNGLCNSCQREKWRQDRQDRVMARPDVYLGKRATKSKRLNFYARPASALEEALEHRRARNRRYYHNQTDEQRAKKLARDKRYFENNREAVIARREARLAKKSALNKAMWAFLCQFPAYREVLWNDFRHAFVNGELFHACVERYKNNGRLTEDDAREFCNAVGVEVLKKIGAVEGFGPESRISNLTNPGGLEISRG